MSDKFYVIRDSSEIVLLDKTNGWIKKRFKFDGDGFFWILIRITYQHKSSS